jgi:hypothetical protein
VPDLTVAEGIEELGRLGIVNRSPPEDDEETDTHGVSEADDLGAQRVEPPVRVSPTSSPSTTARQLGINGVISLNLGTS